MVDENAGSEKGMSAGAQVVAAVVTVGGLFAALWGLGVGSGSAANADKPATCSASHSAPPSSQDVTGDQMCAALNRPDLATLLGVPGEHAVTAWGSDGVVERPDGTKKATPGAEVQLKTHHVKLSSSYDKFPVGQLADLLGSTAQKQTVLGHAAVFSSDRTIALTFNLGGGKGSSAPGVMARSLLIAKDAKDSGGSFELVVWRQDGLLPDDAALIRVAEQVLPTVPGWSAT
ncbi:DUF6215 domain-containing protein [Streptomyces sp. NBC_00536]|uniref:DUF6215 domain-containing protein n=1 Tax=Streptomyces sp. NBC_00536 TaxID=2975769 RepID=UPI002E81B8FC|nr:DUF6215 domain-containing protein [Streptomyces sp. NBC_00536]WUC81684.1 DUF6215 domain-containing protein [Streptomyces sp. NBC_00536]